MALFYALCHSLFILTILMSILIAVLKFADDANVFSEVSSLDKVANLHSDLDKLYEWSEDWQMLINAQKCKCLHIGHKNTYENYTMGGVEVTNSSYERDLGIVTDESLNC